MPRAAGEDEIRRTYQATIDDLYGFVSRRCGGDRELAEDVTQETWLRAVRAWHSDGIPDRPLAWLTTVSRNLLSNHFRQRRLEPLEDDVAESVLDPSATDERARSLLSRALARLPLPQMRLLEAFHFEKRRVADIATSLGVSERAIEGRLRRARQQLKSEIESDPDAEEITHDR